MRPRLPHFLLLCLASWLALGLVITGAIIALVPGGAVGAFVGGAAVGRIRGAGTLRAALAWVSFALVTGGVALFLEPRLSDWGSFASTLILLLPGAFLGGIGAGVVERSIVRTALAYGLCTTVAVTFFRLGHPLIGFALAGPVYAAVISYGATTAE